MPGPPPHRSLWDKVFLVGGNVGIGTHAPKDAIHVYGPGMYLEGVAGSSNEAHAYIQMHERGALDTFAIGCDFTGEGAQNKFRITASAAGGRPLAADAKLVVDQAGNVGVGSTQPAALLDVRGAAIEGAGNGGTPPLVRVQTQGAARPALTVAPDGRVGIGTEAPYSALDVRGGARLSGDLHVDGVVYGQIDGLTLLGTIRTLAMHSVADGMRTIVTNDPVPANRVLFSFKLPPGRFLLLGNLLFRDASGFTIMDGKQWATVGLHAGTPASFAAQADALATIPRTSAGMGPDDRAPAAFHFLADAPEGGDYVIAVACDAGSTLAFDDAPMHAVPISGMGVDPSDAVRSVLNELPMRGAFTVAEPYAAVAGARAVVANDPVGANRVLYSFRLVPGRYLIQGNARFTNRGDITAADGLQAATLALLADTTPATYDPAAAPEPAALAPLPAVAAADPEEHLPAAFQFLVEALTATDYVIAVNARAGGAPLQLEFEGNAHVVPIRAIGLEEGIHVRRALAAAPVRTVITDLPQPARDFQVVAPGAFAAAASDADVFVDGTKLVPGADYALATAFDVQTSNTVFSVTLASDAGVGSTVDLCVRPEVADALTHFPSGYLYQNVTIVNGEAGGIGPEMLAPGALRFPCAGSPVQRVTRADGFDTAYTFLYDGATTARYGVYAADFVSRLAPKFAGEDEIPDFFYEVRAVDATNGGVLAACVASNAALARTTLAIPAASLPAGPAVLALEVRKASAAVGVHVELSGMQWGLCNVVP